MIKVKVFLPRITIQSKSINFISSISFVVSIKNILFRSFSLMTKFEYRFNISIEFIKIDARNLIWITNKGVSHKR